MIKAILFDMDDTLLSINLTAFVARYGLSIGELLADISGLARPVVYHAYIRAQLDMSSLVRDDELTNEAYFNQRFEELCGVPLADPTIAAAVECYEREVVPRMGGGIVQARPRPGSHAIIDQCHDLGLRVALATNPSFTKTAIKARINWAGFDMTDFENVSHMGNSTRVKPAARYYREFCDQLGVAPEECLMVGNDAWRDFPDPDIGMPTAYVGHVWPERAVWRGGLRELSRELPLLLDCLNDGSL